MIPGRPQRSVKEGVRALSAVPNVGDLDLTYEALDLASKPGLHMLVFSVEPRCRSQQCWQLLASWATTRRPALDPNIPWANSCCCV